MPRACPSDEKISRLSSPYALPWAQSPRWKDSAPPPVRDMARAESLTGGGALSFHLGDWAQGRAYGEESLEIFSSLGQARGMAEALVAVGNLALGQGDYASARVSYEQALAKYREVGHRRGMGVSLSNSGRAAELQGDDAAASRLYAEG